MQLKKLAAASGRRRWPICWCCLDRGPGSFDVEDATTLSWSSAAVSEWVMQLKFKEKKIEKHYCLFVISSHNYFTKCETGLNLGWVFCKAFRWVCPKNLAGFLGRYLRGFLNPDKNVHQNATQHATAALRQELPHFLARQKSLYLTSPLLVAQLWASVSQT